MPTIFKPQYSPIINAIVFVLGILPAQSQSTLPVKHELLGISIRGLWSTIRHSPSFGLLPGLVDCGTYNTGKGTTLGLTGTIEYPLENFHTGLSVTYLSRGGRLTTPYDREPAFDSTSGSVVDVISENVLDVQLNYVEVVPQLWWTPVTLGRSSFRISSGISLGFPLQARMQQTRSIISPANAVYITNQQRVINWTNGYTPIRELQKPVLGLRVGIEHLLPIGSRIHLLQNIGYDHLFQPPVRNVQWTIHGIRAELGIRLSLNIPQGPLVPIFPIEPIDTTPLIIPLPTPLPAPTIHVEIVNFKATIEEGTELIATTPLVNAIFFEQNSAILPQRYIKYAHDSIATDDPVVAHRNILLVIAGILRRNPQARIVLEGVIAGEYEDNDTLLARRRAETVAHALIDLGVDPRRIQIVALRLPKIPSNMDYPEGRQENQRVDIDILNTPLLEYVSKQTFAHLRGSVQVHVSGTNLDNTELHVRTDSGEDLILPDTGKYELPFTIRLTRSNDTVITIHTEALLAGTSAISRDEWEIDVDTMPRQQIELSTARFEAILRFDYNSSILSAENRELLRQLVERVPSEATVEIGGSTDVLGDIIRNRKLAEERARATAEYIRTVAGSKKLNIVARGIERSFSDATPEGRFLNRSIRVRLP